MTRARDLADSADKDIAGTLTLDAVNASGVITGLTVEATGDTAAGDNAAMGYTAAEGLILTGQGSTSDITLKNDADAVVFTVPTGTDDILFPDNAKAMFGAGSDLQIYHDGNHSIIKDAGTGNLQINAGNLNVNNVANSANIIVGNDGGAVNLYYDGSKKLETTSTGIDVTGGFAANAGSTITTADNTTQLSLISTDTDANSGPLLELSRSVTGANNDFLGQVIFNGKDTAGNAHVFGRISTQIKTATSGSETSRMVLTSTVGASEVSRIDILPTETVFNDDTVDLDFRVESDNNANTFFIDGGDDIVSIGNDSPRGTAFFHGGQGARLQMEGLSFKEASFAQIINSASNYSSHVLARSRGTALDSNTVLQATDIVGEVSFQGSDGTNFIHGAAITGIVDSGVGANDMPMSLVFSTNVGGTGTTERARFQSSGQFLIGKTASNSGVVGFEASKDGYVYITVNNTLPFFINRLSGAELLRVAVNNATVGGFLNDGGKLQLNSAGSNLIFSVGGTSEINIDGTHLYPQTDEGQDLGAAGNRYDDVFASNGTIQTSDGNEKQDIASMTTAELAVGKRISTLFKTFRWKSKVAANSNARTHSGIIAQDVKTAFEAEGLTVANYALWCSDTWWEHDVEVAAVEAADAEEAVYSEVKGSSPVELEITTPPKDAIEAADAYTRTDSYKTEDEAPSGSTKKTRLGIRYPELLSFLAAYNEQRFAAIETRLTALEG